MDHSLLQFIGYNINEINFKLNPEYDASEQEVNVNLEFDSSMNINNDEITINLSANIFNQNDFNNKKSPFFLKITISGLFIIEKFDIQNELHKNLAEKNTLAILFPYLRSVITSTTSNANISPLIIPTLNITNYIEERSST